MLCVGLVLHSLCHAGAKLIKAVGPRGGAGPRCADLCRPGKTGAVAWRVAGRRKASGLPGAAEVGLILGRREGGSFAKALMRGLPADGTWRKLARSGREGSLFSAICDGGTEWTRLGQGFCLRPAACGIMARQDGAGSMEPRGGESRLDDSTELAEVGVSPYLGGVRPWCQAM